jgi:sulfate/thiosulfate transport system permease protein
MSGAVSRSPWRGWAPVLLLLGVGWLLLVIALPLGTVFTEAFSQGVAAFARTFQERDAWAAVRLTLTVAAISVPLNAVFGLAAAWLIARFDFWGKGVLTAFIDLPFSISPVISGLVWVLLFGSSGWFAPALDALGIRVLYTTTALVLATVLVTLPFVARELIPLMQEQGDAEEAAAVTLGAGAWTVFSVVTLPNVRWALLYGVLLCNARAMGEFGAVSVVSGHIRGLTNTLPLHVEILYNEYDFIGAFATATVLAGLALVTLLAKTVLEWRYADELSATRRH